MEDFAQNTIHKIATDSTTFKNLSIAVRQFLLPNDYISYMGKLSVKDFYDNEGWKFVGANSRDAIINENLSRVADEYVRKVRLRIQEHLGSGDYLLDVGCGPIQYPEYVEYSQNFKYRVCVDLSAAALKVAKEKIGDHGIFIQGDYLEIDTPKEAPFAGATLINVLYHVDKLSQEGLVRKMLMDISPGGKLVVIYSNPRTVSANVTKVLVYIKRLLLRLSKGTSPYELKNPIYFYRHPLTFWKRFVDIADIDMFAWRTFSPALEKLIFNKYFQGRILLRILFRIEQFKWWSTFAEYPLIVLTKKN